MADGTSLPIQKILSAIIERSSSVYDTIYFYGQPDTVLKVIDQLSRNYLHHNANQKILRVNAKAFKERQLQSIRNSNPIIQYSEKDLSDCALFIFENIDNIAGLQTMEQTIYGLFDWLLEHNKQLVVTGNVSIAHMLTLAPRIRTQLDGGISCQID